MNVSYQLTEFMTARVWGVVDGLIFLFLTIGFGAAVGWISRATVIARFKLRTRLIGGLLLVAAGSLAALSHGVPPKWVVIASTGAAIALVAFGLRGISKLGIINAFQTTTEGISAEKSLKLVKRNLSFLGIGGSKLSSSPELRKAFERCKKEGGSVRFLLSDPKNEGLKRLSGQNQKDSEAYKTRVAQSIRDIMHHANQAGVSCEVRLYAIDNEKALSRFRMMFIDDRLCIFSHLVWNENEGMDNSQIILLRHGARAEAGLYTAYQAFFEDLWEASSGRVVTSMTVL